MAEIKKVLGLVTAYGYAKSKGYTGTEEEFAELMASYAHTAQDAEQSAQDAEAWAVGERDGIAVEAGDDTYHNNAKWYAEVAQDYAGDASESAQAAETRAQAAQTSAQNAGTSETNAGTSAVNAALSAQAAQASADQAAHSVAQGGYVSSAIVDEALVFTITNFDDIDFRMTDECLEVVYG